MPDEMDFDQQNGDARAVPALLNALHDFTLRLKAAAALRRIGEAAVPGLLDVVQDPNASVREDAVRILGRIGDVRAVPKLVEALGDVNPGVCVYAARALGEIRDPTAAAGLLEVLHSPNKELRFAAAWALAQLGRDNGAAILYATLQNEDSLVLLRDARNALLIIGYDPDYPPPSLEDSPPE